MLHAKSSPRKHPTSLAFCSTKIYNSVDVVRSQRSTHSPAMCNTVERGTRLDMDLPLVFRVLTCCLHAKLFIITLRYESPSVVSDSEPH